MNFRKSTAIPAVIIGGVSLLFILIHLVLFLSQPVYRYGLEFRLTDSGYRVTKVVPGMAAARSGLRVGDTVVRVGRAQVAALNALRLQSTTAYLSATTTLFPGSPLSLERADGTVLQLDPAVWTVMGVLGSSLDTTLSNIINGFLIVLIGTVFTVRGNRKGRQDTALSLYFAFTCAAGISLALSYFHSHWTLSFLQAHFLLLIVFGPIAGITLASFAAHFPEPAPAARHAAWWLLLLPVSRVALLLFGFDDLFGLSHFLVHITVLSGIAIFVMRLVFQYRWHNALGRRRLRWVIAGSVASVTPYVLFLATGLVVGTFVEYQNPGVLNQLAAYFVLVFPIAMGIGLVDFDRLDVDRVLTATLTYLVLGSIIAFGTGLLTVVTRTAPLTLRYALIILITVIFGPTMYAQVTRVTAWIVNRRRTRVAHGLEELRSALFATYRTTDVFGHAAQFADEYLGAPAAAVLQLAPDATESTPAAWRDLSEECGLLATDPLTADVLRLLSMVAAAGAQSNPIELPNGAVALRCSSGIGEDYLLLLKGRKDGDIFVDADREVMRELAYVAGQTLRAAHYYEDVLDRNTQLEALIDDKSTLLREVHHRVKNNLQIMASLLSLQMAESGPEVASALELGVARIQSMALVHEAVFQDADVERIDLAEYVSSLSSYLGGSMRGVRITVESIERVVSAGFAVPLGLILLETIGQLVHEGRGELIVRLSQPHPAEPESLLLEVHAHPAIAAATTNAAADPLAGTAATERPYGTSGDLIIEALCSQIGARRIRAPGTVTFEIGYP